MNIKKLAIVRIITIIGSLSKVSAVTVRTFKKYRNQNSASYSRSQIDGSNSILDIISLVNKYLWFAIWFFCFLFMIWNGYKLITANGDEKAMKSAKDGLLWSWIWLAICFLAYIIVNLAVKLFA